MKLGDLSVTKDTKGKSIAFFSQKPSVGVTKELIEAMLKWSRLHNNQDLRVCLHKDTEDEFHQMIVLQHNGRYRRPHKHTRAESCHIVKGKIMVILFHDNGSIKECMILDPVRMPISRIGANQWHINVPLSSIVIFHESKGGPFVKHTTEFPVWAPSEERKGSTYQHTLIKKINTGYKNRHV